ncbi:hypothetical protein BJX99DRAFT_254046 [Aspergillus californicus]
MPTSPHTGRIPISPYPNGQYTITWLCASWQEKLAAKQALDENHGRAQKTAGRYNIDDFTLGSMGKHKVVIISIEILHSTATRPDEKLKNLRTMFPNIRLILSVGVASGLPVSDELLNTRDVRLGDIVVGYNRQDPGRSVVRHEDYGDYETTAVFTPPPRLLRTALKRLCLDPESSTDPNQGTKTWWARNPDHRSRWLEGLTDTPDPYTDRHPDLDSHIWIQEGGGQYTSLAQRPKRATKHPAIHQATIGTSYGLYTTHMERVGIQFHQPSFAALDTGLRAVGTYWPLLAIRGIYNYADGKSERDWVQYAAWNAAFLARIVLDSISVTDVLKEPALAQVRVP